MSKGSTGKRALKVENAQDIISFLEAGEFNPRLLVYTDKRPKELERIAKDVYEHYISKPAIPFSDENPLSEPNRAFGANITLLEMNHILPPQFANMIHMAPTFGVEGRDDLEKAAEYGPYKKDISPEGIRRSQRNSGSKDGQPIVP